MKLPAQTYISNSQPLISSLELVKVELGLVKKLIDEQLVIQGSASVLSNSISEKSAHRDIDKLLESIRNRSGKMIRPGLVLLAGKCFDSINDEHIRVAASVEMVHNATLLHDDVIDEGKQRRGKPTINSLWGNESAVLLGDFLLSRVFRLSAELEPEVLKVIATAAVRLCEGELEQITQRRNWQLSEPEYIDVITAKSAFLFESCCRLGAVLAGADESKVKMLSQFGLNAGIAFQITDDLLDIIGDEARTGKTIGSDVNKHKPTLAVIHLLKSVNESQKKIIVDSFLENNNSKHNKKSFIDILKNNGSLEYAKDQAQKYVSNAIGILDALPQNQAKTALVETAKFMGDRTS